MRLFRLPADLSPRVRKNTIHYYADISWWGLYAGSTVAFLTIYAARIGATPGQIGLLTALPAFLALLLSLPFAGVVARLGPHRATWAGAVVSRALLFVYALLPFFLPQEYQIWAFIGAACLIAVPSILPGIAFPQLMIESLPADWRGYVVGARNAFLSIISFVITLLCGQILTHMDFPAGYQVVFFIGGLGALMTSYHLYHVRPMTTRSALDRIAAPPPVPAPGPGGRWLPEVNAQGRRFLRVMIMLFLFNVTGSMVNPLAPNILVHRLRLSDAWISVGAAASSLIVFGMSLFIAQALHRTGNRRATAAGAALMALQALLLAVAGSPAAYLLYVLAGGVGQGILMSAQYNYHLENVPENDRARWLSWSLLLGNAAVLVGSLGGPALAALAGAPLALGLLAALRLAWGAALLRWG